MDETGVKNTDILDLLKYSQKILEVNKIEDIKKISNELSSIKTAKPKVINCFDNTNEYYKDLLNELFYKIKKLEKIPQIIFNINRKNYWLSIIKLLSILLKPNHLEDSFVKMIFYFITKIFDKDLDFLEEKDFLSNNLYAMLDVIFQDEKQLLLFPEISYLLNDNKDIYNCFLCEENEEHFYNMIENDIEKKYPNKFNHNNIYKNMKNFKNRKFYISMIIEYIVQKYELQISESIYQYNSYKKIIENRNSLNIFYNIYLHYHKIYSHDFHLIELESQKIYFNLAETYQNMSKVIEDQNFLVLLEKIMSSEVMREIYQKINKSDKYNIFEYYCNFIKEFKNIIQKNTFILMRLSYRCKAITFRFLKIVINSEDLTIHKNQNSDNDVKLKLIRAYLIFIIIPELNHLIKIINNIDVDTKNEGGKEVMELLFGNYLEIRNINLSQAEYILDINNWNKKCLKDFKEEYSKILDTSCDDDSIKFPYSGYGDFCYYGFLKPDN